MGDLLPFERSEPAVPEAEPLWRELVGDRLRERRLGRGERLVDVAGRAGVSTQYLSEVERGLKDPSSEILSAITGALGTSVRGLSRDISAAPRSGAASRPTGPLCLAA
ncbi:helix-turn-helix domain-containing protein [Nocardioides terrisoli]|uniref:helix-turn-helix domain-containing protein n=1 Tax=Nocardioides terrisoli TaxID=3388267 RepID=UPI00287B7C59|nr:helix-turn-helix transcriptional regulator [Nocardioides marmorisolisilvae]